MVQYYISLYYIEVTLTPDILKSEEEQYSVIDKLNEEYKQELQHRFPEWHNEESENHFRTHIDYLTKVYTNRERQSSMRTRSQELAAKVFEKLERSKQMRMNN